MVDIATNLPPSGVGFKGNISRRVGNIRAVTLEGRLVNTDQHVGIVKSVHESIVIAFGESPIDAQLDADKRSYELRDDPLTELGQKNAE